MDIEQNFDHESDQSPLKVTGSIRIIKLTERIVRPISWLTLAGLGVLLVLRLTGVWTASGWIAEWLLPILASAMVGYLTNFFAIEMLFKPYRRTDHHWLRYVMFGLWRQGLIPANKDQIGHKLAKEIPAKLIDPDEVAEDLSRAATELLENQSLLARIREVASRFLQRYSRPIAAFIAPHVEAALRAGLRDNLTPDNLRNLWDEMVAGYLSIPENRTRLAATVVEELRKRAPELTAMLHNNLRSGVHNYLQEKLHFLPKSLIPSDFVAGLVDYLDWEHIQRQVCEKLSEESTQQMIRDEMLHFLQRIRESFNAPETQQQLQEFLARGTKKLEEILHNYLQEKLPELADQTLRSPELWTALQEQLLPALRKWLGNYLRGDGKEVIITRLNLSHRIEAAIAAQDVTEFHQTLLSVIDEHLVAIQVLGYLLGAVAGVLLAAAGF